MEKLTTKQKRTLDYIKRYIDRNGVAPSYTDMSGHFNINVNAVRQVIDALIRKGWIEKMDGVARGLKIIDNDEHTKFRENTLFIPLYGNVAAGEPVFANDNIEGYLPVKKTKRMNGELFSVTVRGDSMIDKHIVEKDIIIVKKQNYANDGDVVVALLGDEVTVKIFRQKGSDTYLQPANNSYSNIRKPFEILGIYMGIIRDLDLIYEEN